MSTAPILLLTFLVQSAAPSRSAEPTGTVLGEGPGGRGRLLRRPELPP